MVLHFKTAADAKPASKETDDLKTDDPRECCAKDIVKKSDLPEFKMFEEAVKSTDPDVIKNARAIVKGKVTSAVNVVNSLN